jgi:IS5 family transposase
MTFENYYIQNVYERVKSLDDPLVEFDDKIDWECFRPMIVSIFLDNKITGGRPHTDEVKIVKILVILGFYNLSDPQLEFQLCDRLSFRNFVGIQDEIPDFPTIWRIRNRLRKKGVDKLIWKELQRQIDEQGFEVESGCIQDATIVVRELGRKRYGKEKKAKKNDELIEYTQKQENQIDRDASFTVKNGQVQFGYKDHVKSDIKWYLVRDIDVTSASVHDNQVDLSKEGVIEMYRDKGYFGHPITALNVKDQTMKRCVRGRKLNGGEQKRNRFISRIRAPCERIFAVVKGVFNGGYSTAKSLERVKIREFFKFFAFNLYQLRTLYKKRNSVSFQ